MPSRIDMLIEAYSRHVHLPWGSGLAPPQRVWFALYPKEEERRLRYRLEGFRLATAAAGKRWHLVDITDLFATWIDQERYRDMYFSNPRALASKLPRFLDATVEHVVREAAQVAHDDGAVLAILGVAGLFGFTQVSELVPRVVSKLAGRLLVFFPGSRDGNVYRLLDAREGWNYLATPISGTDDGGPANG